MDARGKLGEGDGGLLQGISTGSQRMDAESKASLYIERRMEYLEKGATSPRCIAYIFD